MNSVLDILFSVDLCVRKHAKVYGENRQLCFNVYLFQFICTIRSDISRLVVRCLFIKNLLLKFSTFTNLKQLLT